MKPELPGALQNNSLDQVINTEEMVPPDLFSTGNWSDLRLFFLIKQYVRMSSTQNLNEM